MDPRLYVAAADGAIHVLQQCVDIHVQLTPKKNTVLHVAAQFGQAGCVDRILELVSASSLLQQPNEKGDTPVLHLAAREGHLIVVENLIEAAKQLHGDTERGDTTVCVVPMVIAFVTGLAAVLPSSSALWLVVLGELCVSTPARVDN